ncbi:hypothetical protein OF83DRAFT_645595 [Amylostereum chailletii]|nr:hypothetical protein OF83DRAFT_645595 [Amylostereum chailletii]
MRRHPSRARSPSSSRSSSSPHMPHRLPPARDSLTQRKASVSPEYGRSHSRSSRRRLSDQSDRQSRRRSQSPVTMPPPAPAGTSLPTRSPLPSSSVAQSPETALPTKQQARRPSPPSPLQENWREISPDFPSPSHPRYNSVTPPVDVSKPHEETSNTDDPGPSSENKRLSVDPNDDVDMFDISSPTTQFAPTSLLSPVVALQPAPSKASSVAPDAQHTSPPDSSLKPSLPETQGLYIPTAAPSEPQPGPVETLEAAQVRGSTPSGSTQEQYKIPSPPPSPVPMSLKLAWDEYHMTQVGYLPAFLPSRSHTVVT